MIEVKVDEKGRIQLPKEVRRELGITAKGEIVLVKEATGYAMLPKKRYKHPTEALKSIAVKGSGHPNPKKEAREWMLSKIEKGLK